jgi:hypothetical protein
VCARNRKTCGQAITASSGSPTSKIENLKKRYYVSGDKEPIISCFRNNVIYNYKQANPDGYQYSQCCCTDRSLPTAPSGARQHGRCRKRDQEENASAHAHRDLTAAGERDRRKLRGQRDTPDLEGPPGHEKGEDPGEPEVAARPWTTGNEPGEHHDEEGPEDKPEDSATDGNAASRQVQTSKPVDDPVSEISPGGLLESFFASCHRLPPRPETGPHFWRTSTIISGVTTKRLLDPAKSDKSSLSDGISIRDNELVCQENRVATYGRSGLLG